MKNWEDLKQKQSNYLKGLYPKWFGDFDGSEPAELAELMNLSYELGLRNSKKEIARIIDDMIMAHNKRRHSDTKNCFDPYEKALEDLKKKLVL